MSRMLSLRGRALLWLVVLSCVALPVLATEADDPAATEAATDASEETVEALAEGGARTSLTQSMQGEEGLSIRTLCTNCNNADLSLGGLGNDHVSVTCDGVPVASGLGQIYLLSVMPPTVIDKIAVTKGAGEAGLEGAAVGGAIEIERREPEDHLDFNASADAGSYGWSSTRVDLSGGSKRFKGLFAGSWATSDTIDPDGDGSPNLPSYDRTTLEGRGEVEIGRNQRLRVGIADYSEDQEDGPAAVDWGFNPMTFQFGFRGYNLENVQLERRQYDAAYEASFRDGGKLTVAGYFTDRSQDIDETSNALVLDAFTPSYFIDEEQTYGSFSWSQPFGNKLTLGLGISASESAYDVIDVSFNDSNNLPGFTFQEELTEGGAWLDAELAVNGQVTLSFGVRYVDFNYDDNEFRDEWLAIELPEDDRILPRGALSWKPNDELQLRFSAGLGYRAPAPAFDEVCCGRRYRGNRGVAIEETTSLGIEATYQTGPKFRLAGSLFATDFDNMILKFATLSFNYRHTYQNVNVVDARQIALDLQARYQALPWLAVKGSVGWLDADNRSEDDAIVALIDFFNTPIEKTFTASSIPYVVEERATVGVDIGPRFWGLSGSLQAQYQGPVLIQEFDQDNPDPDPNLGGSSVQEELFETDSFWMLNLSVNKELKGGLALFAGVDNITDEYQSDLGDFHFDYNWGALRGRYYYGGVSYRLPERR